MVGIKQLPISERPREKLLRGLSGDLSLVELIAILLGTGSKTFPVDHLAREVVSRFPNIKELSLVSVEELCQISGIGPAKALQLKAAFELGIRLSRHRFDERPRIKHPIDAYRLVKDRLETQEREHLLEIICDTKGGVIAIELISIGTLSASLVHPREVFSPAIRKCGASLILAHNHPSGDPTPSKEDILITKDLIKAGRLMGLPLRDHIIVGNGRFLSLREQLKLQF